MLLRPKITKIAEKSSFVSRRFFDDFLDCKKAYFSPLGDPQGGPEFFGNLSTRLGKSGVTLLGDVLGRSGGAFGAILDDSDRFLVDFD